MLPPAFLEEHPGVRTVGRFQKTREIRRGILVAPPIAETGNGVCVHCHSDGFATART